MANHFIDLNADLGEGMPNDALLMPFISSANIACGYHAGNEDTMRHTMGLCMQYDVAIGVHPSFNDRDNFGRTNMHLPNEQAYLELLLPQLELGAEIAYELGATLHHIKPHGALYNLSANDPAIAATIAKIVKLFDHNLVLYGLSGSHSILAAKAIGLKTAAEVFADRTYQPDGTLTPRSVHNATITNDAQALLQVHEIITAGIVTAVDGSKVPIAADTICLHGDGPHATLFAKKIHDLLLQNQFQIKTISA